MAQSQKRPTYTSPKGTFKFPKLTVPDTKFKPEGEYSVKLVVSSDAPGVAKLISECDRQAAASLAEAKQNARNAAEAKKWETKYLPYAEVLDDETGEPTGDVEFKFTMKASGVAKKTGKPWSRKPALFDAKGKLITGEPTIGGGSTGKVSYQFIPYAPTTTVGASVKLALEAAQIIELREYTAQDASAFGFQEEEGGYEFSEEDASGEAEGDSSFGYEDDEGDTGFGGSEEPEEKVDF